MEVKVFCVKAYKARFATRKETVNHELDEVKGTCGHAYIARITDTDDSYGDACTIGILFLRSDFTHNHGVENLFSYVSMNIFISNDAESVCSLHTLVLGPFDYFPTPWHIRQSSLA